MRAAKHDGHLRDERQRQQRRDDERRQILPVAPALDGSLVLGLQERVDCRRRVITRPAHRLDQRLRRRAVAIELDMRGFAGEVDGRANPVGAIQHLLDPGRARGAGHAGELEVKGTRGHRK